MTELKVLVCDDIPQRGKEAVDEIERVRDRLEEVGVSISIQTLFAEKLSRELKKLFEHIANRLPPNDAAQSAGAAPFECSEFDRDIVVIDNNLAALDIQGARLTAETVAGFIRAFTDACYVVSLNKNPEIDFDLRYLVGDYRTQADVALNACHLSNPALWTGNPSDAEDGFLPWYWPMLGSVSQRRREQIEFTRKYLKSRSTIVRALEFPDRAVEYLSRHATGALSPRANTEDTGVQDEAPPGAVKFMDFFKRSCRSLPVYKDRDRLANQASEGDEEASKVIARVVAAEFDKWLRRDVLGPQDVLVDVPHLLLRMPFLLGDKVNEVDRWHAAPTIAKPSFGLDPRIYDEHVASAKFFFDPWVRSPCFWWPALKENEALNKCFFSSNRNWPHFVFCEDVSRFELLARNAEDSEPMRFSAEFEGSWSRRYVYLCTGKKYAPISRIAK